MLFMSIRRTSNLQINFYSTIETYLFWVVVVIYVQNYPLTISYSMLVMLKVFVYVFSKSVLKSVHQYYHSFVSTFNGLFRLFPHSRPISHCSFTFRINNTSRFSMLDHIIDGFVLIEILYWSPNVVTLGFISAMPRVSFLQLNRTNCFSYR